MKKLTSLLLILFSVIILIPSCNRVKFNTVCVGFHLEHPDFKVIEPVFDTISETYLLVEAYNEGATFETVTEQVLFMEEHTEIQLVDIHYINILSDVEEDLICAAPCITYLDEANFEFKTIENNYITRSYQRVSENGNGDFVEAVYEEREYYRLMTDARVEAGASNTLAELQKTLNLPDTTTFENHWNRERINQGAEDCGEASTFRVIY